MKTFAFSALLALIALLPSCSGDKQKTYTVATLKLIVDHYPLKSIKDIGNVLKGPWKQEVVKLFGRLETLDHVEHDLLREKYKDLRVHFSVNCASIGCPALRPEAFQAAKLDAQLDAQGRAFLRDTSKNHLDAANKTLYLSPIFDWFKGDFTAKSGTVENFVAPYFKPADRDIIQRGWPLYQKHQLQLEPQQTMKPLLLAVHLAFALAGPSAYHSLSSSSPEPGGSFRRR